ncbi:hypothetical protein MKW92_003491 [Papaver armeniacum]|nr:hypothetical protein MKW92_003491 [Papaver armeniacum]
MYFARTFYNLLIYHSPVEFPVSQLFSLAEPKEDAVGLAGCGQITEAYFGQVGGGSYAGEVEGSGISFTLWQKHVKLLGTTVNICRRGILLPLLCILWNLEIKCAGNHVHSSFFFHKQNLDCLPQTG